MSTIYDAKDETVANHTLAYLRRIDRRMDGLEKTLIEVVGILSRFDLKFDRIHRDNRESFARVERDLHEIKSDAILADNRILDRFSETLDLSRRMNRNDERLDELESAHSASADSQGQRP